MARAIRAVAIAIAGFGVAAIVLAFLVIGEQRAPSGAAVVEAEPTSDPGLAELFRAPDLASTPRPTARPRPTSTPLPTPGPPVPLNPQPIGNILLAHDDPAANGKPFLYNVAQRDLKRLNIDAGTYALYGSPSADVALAIPYVSTNSPTLLIDFERGTAQQLLPNRATLVRWLDKNRVRLVVGASSVVPVAGVYELDLSNLTIRGPMFGGDSPSGTERVSIAQYKRDEIEISIIDVTIPSREAADPRTRTTYVVPYPNLAEGNSLVTWAPDGSWLLVGIRNRAQAVRLDRNGTTTVVFDASRRPGAAVGIRDWKLSPDGAYAAITVCCDPAPETWIASTDSSGTLLGPYPKFEWKQWHPGGELLLGLANQCDAGGHNPAIIDTRTGDLRLNRNVTTIWGSEWSADGTAIVASVGNNVYIIDPVSLEAVKLPPFGTFTPRGPNDYAGDVHWSGSGNWLFANAAGPRDRCLG